MKVIFNKDLPTESEFFINSARENYFVEFRSTSLIIAFDIENNNINLMEQLENLATKVILKNIFIENNNQIIYQTEKYLTIKNIINNINQTSGNYSLTMELIENKDES